MKAISNSDRIFAIWMLKQRIGVEYLKPLRHNQGSRSFGSSFPRVTCVLRQNYGPSNGTSGIQDSQGALNAVA